MELILCKNRRIANGKRAYPMTELGEGETATTIRRGLVARPTGTQGWLLICEALVRDADTSATVFSVGGTLNWVCFFALGIAHQLR